MARILILGSVNLDRVWRIEAPLRLGGRTGYGEVGARVGGGGFNTGCALIALGHDVAIAASLAGDAGGRLRLEALVDQGFDVRHVRLAEGVTRPNEIFVDPCGERTIVFPAGAEAQPEPLPEVEADLIYVAQRRVDQPALARALRRSSVVAQYPLEAGQRRPASVLIGAASDLPESGSGDAFRRARAIAGEALEAFVLTDGPEAVRIWTRDGPSTAPVDPRPAVEDTTGAGDVFAAGFIDAYLRGDAPTEAARHASAIASLFLADRRAFIRAKSRAKTAEEAFAHSC